MPREEVQRHVQSLREQREQRAQGAAREQAESSFQTLNLGSP